MARGVGRAKAKLQRRKNAKNSQEHLSSIITDVSMPMLARRGAAKHLVKTSSRNGLPLPPKQRHWICRGCKSLLIPGNNARVRIRSGQEEDKSGEWGTSLGVRHGIRRFTKPLHARFLFKASVADLFPEPKFRGSFQGISFEVPRGI